MERIINIFFLLVFFVYIFKLIQYAGRNVYFIIDVLEEENRILKYNKIIKKIFSVKFKDFYRY